MKGGRKKGRKQDSVALLQRDSYCGWTKSVRITLKTMGNHCALVFAGDSSETRVASVVQNFVHPQYGNRTPTESTSLAEVFRRNGFELLKDEANGPRFLPREMGEPYHRFRVVSHVGLLEVDWLLTRPRGLVRNSPDSRELCFFSSEMELIPASGNEPDSQGHVETSLTV